jgi:predicted GIY-YIG superfamily endonuclease
MLNPHTAVYLIHLEQPLHHAQHYIGFTNNINRRLLQHWRGKGSPLLRAARAAGIHFDIAFVWYGGTRLLERRLKNRKKARRLCPICNPRIARTFTEIVAETDAIHLLPF